MRKNLKVVPVFLPDATPSDPPIREISAERADEMVAAGVASPSRAEPLGCGEAKVCPRAPWNAGRI